ncbi:MAG: helix-turn-helix transcriptional regulator [Chitinophagaceae bacterium]
MKHVGRLRMDLGLNQIEFAELIGCSEARLAMAESGRRKLTHASHNVFSQLSSIPLPQPAVTPDNVYTQGQLKILEGDLRTRRSKINGLELAAENLEQKTVQAGNMIALVDSMQARGARAEELLMEELIVLQRKAIAKQSRYRKEWFNCLTEIAGLQAASEKGAALKLLLPGQSPSA